MLGVSWYFENNVRRCKVPRTTVKLVVTGRCSRHACLFLEEVSTGATGEASSSGRRATSDWSKDERVEDEVIAISA